MRNLQNYLALIGMAAGLVAFAFSTFETKEVVNSLSHQLMQRLDRIDDKLWEIGNNLDDRKK